MTLASFAWKDVRRRPTRTALTAIGVAVAASCLFTVLAFERGYYRALREEMSRSGTHMYVSTEGCPLEAASLILHGGEIPRFLPEKTVDEVARIPGIRVAAPMLIFASPNREGRLDLFYGVDPRIVGLRPYWKIEGRFPEGPGEILLGAETALVEKRAVGDKVYFESIDREFEVAGILARSGTQDDGFSFLALSTLQEVFHKPGQLTAVAVAVEDLEELGKVEVRIKDKLPDVYVVTERQMTEEIVGMARGSKALLYALAIIALLVSVLGVLNTVLMSVFEKLREFGYMRCVGATRWDVFRLVTLETAIVSTVGAIAGVAAGAILGSSTDRFLRVALPYAPAGPVISIEPSLILLSLVLTILVGTAAGMIPALKASQIAPMEAVRHE